MNFVIRPSRAHSQRTKRIFMAIIFFCSILYTQSQSSESWEKRIKNFSIVKSLSAIYWCLCARGNSMSVVDLCFFLLETIRPKMAIIMYAVCVFKSILWLLFYKKWTLLKSLVFTYMYNAHKLRSVVHIHQTISTIYQIPKILVPRKKQFFFESFLFMFFFWQ